MKVDIYELMAIVCLCVLCFTSGYLASENRHEPCDGPEIQKYKLTEQNQWIKIP
jgi:hypothetical protein